MTANAFPMVLALVAAALTPTLAAAQARTFVVHGQGGSRAHFVSDAPLETINGVTSAVSGEFTVDPTNLASASGAIEVQVGTLRTGIDLRDEHLRSDAWLDTARFPTAKFELTGVRGATRLTAGQTARVTLTGRFTLHGRTHDVTANAQIQLMPVTPEMQGQTAGPQSDVIRVRASFRIRLTDYGITVPSVVQLKVSNDIAIDVSFRATAR